MSASVAFKWGPFESARTYTNEDDLISELLGREEETIDTMPRSLRVDFVLRASLPYEIQVPLLGVDRWRSWAHATHGSLHTLLPTEAVATDVDAPLSKVLALWRGASLVLDGPHHSSLPG